MESRKKSQRWWYATQKLGDYFITDTDLRGADVNRNFDYFWGSAGSGSSGTQSSNLYRGPSAASEPETQIMVDFIEDRNFKTAVWHHTYANGIPHPYGGNPTFVSGVKMKCINGMKI